MLEIMFSVPGRWSRPVRPPWSAGAGLGQVAWFLGNLYEAVVDMPQLLADAQPQRRPGLMSPGSPLRYYAPVAPLTATATTTRPASTWPSDIRPTVDCTTVVDGIIEAGASTLYVYIGR
jgi:hypothetical protein